jgi:hypothetical protein
MGAVWAHAQQRNRGLSQPWRSLREQSRVQHSLWLRVTLGPKASSAIGLPCLLIEGTLVRVDQHGRSRGSVITNIMTLVDVSAERSPRHDP